MTTQDRVAFSSALADCARIFGKLRDLDEMGEGYWVALRDLELSSVQAGLRACAQSCRYFPKPAEIREAAEQSAAEVRRLSGDRSRPSCDWCGGDGWEPRYCIGRDTRTSASNTHEDPTVPCQRPHRHDPHGYMVRCRCWAARHAREDVA